MTTATPVYGTPTALTITLASLAQDATNLTAGRESTVLDQKDSLDAIDVLVGGKITTGGTVTDLRQIEVWAYASWDDAEYTGGATGSDANLTAVGKTGMALLTIIPTTSTANATYRFGPYSIAQAFGGSLPVQFGIFVVHNTGGALHATGSNHEIFYTTVKYESA